MNFRTALPIAVTIAVFLALLEFGGAYIIHFSVQRYNQTVPTEEKNYFGCYCNGQTRSAKLEKYVLDKMFQSLQNQKFCAEEKSQYCDWLDECHNCTGVMETCTAISGPGSGYNCTKETFEMREKFLITLNSTIGKLGLKHPKRRQTVTCFHPPALKTASLSFLKYPSFIWAKQKCILGHTLKEGISREMRCLHSENKWKPAGFEECLPFVDCAIRLVSPGRAECATATTEKASTCNVTCHAYEGKNAVSKRTYECKTSDGWKPKMPHCVVVGTGIDVVPAPKIQIHPTEKEPETKPPKKMEPTKKMEPHKKGLKVVKRG